MTAHPANARPDDPSLLGIGGAPTRNTTLPKDDAARKAHPVASGVIDYFPDAIALVAHLSFTANEKHNPGEPLHWARGKSTDEPDTMMRHFMCRSTFDDDGHLHDVKIAWRALANLQKEIERRKAAGEPICQTKYYAPTVPQGVRVRVVTPRPGAYGATGATGYLLPENARYTHGREDGPKVRLDNGSIWGLGVGAVLERA